MTPERKAELRVFKDVHVDECLDALEEAEHVPGQWACPKCEFRLTKNLLDPGTMGVSVDVSQSREVCPNDGKTMRPVTWEEYVDDLAEGQEALVDERNAARKELEALQT